MPLALATMAACDVVLPACATSAQALALLASAISDGVKSLAKMIEPEGISAKEISHFDVNSLIPFLRYLEVLKTFSEKRV